MVLGVDIDDCIIMNSSYFLSHIAEEDLPPKILNRIMDNIYNIMAGIIPKDLYPYLRPIWQKNNMLYDTYPHVSEVLYRLRERGVKIIIVTGRCNEMLADAEETTIKYLKEHDIPYDQILFDSRNKAQICLEQGINIFVEDSIKHAKAISEAGIKTLLFDSIVNKDEIIDVTRVENWLEIENIVNQILE